MTVTLLLTADEASDLARVLGDAEEMNKPAAIWRAIDGMGPKLRHFRKERPAVIECTMDPLVILKLIDARLLDIYGHLDTPPESSSSAWLKRRILSAYMATVG